MTIAQQLGRKAREFVNLARVVAISRGSHAAAHQLAQDKLIGPTIKSIVAGSHRVYTGYLDISPRCDTHDYNEHKRESGSHKVPPMQAPPDPTPR
jgi:hypothetical protein